MPFEEIVFPDGRSVFISPLPRLRMAALEAMLTSLSRRWMEYQQCTALMVEDDAAWELFQAIASLFPRLDRPGTYGFDLSPMKCDVHQLEELFLYQREEDGFRPPRLVKMHEYEPIERSPSGDEVEPIASSGDPDMDLLAIVAAGFNCQDGLALLDRLSGEEIHRFLYYVGELRRDPEERKMENLAEDFASWKEENSETLRRELGFGPITPRVIKPLPQE